MFDRGSHATIVPADPARSTTLALWGPDEHAATDAGAPTERLVLPGDDGVGVRTCRVESVALIDVLDDLVLVPSDDPTASPSVIAWGVVARHALALVAQGRLTPASSALGHDEWHLSPLDPAERALVQALAGWLPPAAHCLLVDGTGRDPRVLHPRIAIAAMWTAIADLLPRTAAAGTVSRQPAWAGRAPVDVTALRTHLGSNREGRAILGLRLHPPQDGDGPFQLELQLRSGHRRDLVTDLGALWRGTALAFDGDDESDALIGLRRAAAHFPPVAPLLEQSTPTGMELTDAEAVELLLLGTGELAAAGVEVLVPEELTRSVRATARVTGTQERPGSAGGGRFDLSSLCELSWDAELDGTTLSEAERRRLLGSSRPLVRLRDQWVLVDPTVVAKLQRKERLSGADALAAALGAQVQIGDEHVFATVEGAPASLAERLRVAAEPHELDEPDDLRATLRPYQRRGLAWLNEMVELGLGGILADDMGLGKTVQLIALHLHRRPYWNGPSLVICPASVVGNWERELARFAPAVTVRRYHGSERHLDGLEPGELVVTTYGLVRRDADALARQRWSLVVADEAQMVKNPVSATARSLRRLDSIARVAMTGTPVENRLEDLWALLDWTTPGLLGDLTTFRRSVALPVERDRDEAAAHRLARLLAPFVLRRRKDDPMVAPELPPRTETEHPVQLTAEQATLYRAVTEETLRAIGSAQGIERRGLVLKLLTALKQICNHPAQFRREDGPLAGRSGKLDAAEDLIGAIRDAGDSVLVFTQYVRMGELLVARLGELGHDAAFLHGALPLRRREQMVDEFQRGRPGVFVISLRAGGTGLNLTRATHVVHFDRWWNPAVEQQASDRAWRIGQDRPVQVHQLLSEGTVEDRIAALLRDKRDLADRVVGAGEAWLTELDDAELAELVRLGNA